MKSIRPLLSFITLAIGIAALACVMVPRVLSDARLASTEAHPAMIAKDGLHSRPGTTVFEYKGMKIGFSASASAQDNNQDSSAITAVETPKPINWLPVAAILLALSGTLLGFVACWREQSNVMVVPGIGFCFFVLFWPYLSPVLGIALGVALLLFLLGSFTPVFSL